MTDVLHLYASGLSYREVEERTGLSARQIGRRARAAGIARTKSEGMTLRYNPVTLNPDDCLVLKLPKNKTVIKSYYARPLQLFAGRERV